MTFDWMHAALALVAFVPVLAKLLAVLWPESKATQMAKILADAIREQAHPETQAAVVAKAGVAGLEDHPLVAHATGESK